MDEFDRVESRPQQGKSPGQKMITWMELVRQWDSDRHARLEAVLRDPTYRVSTVQKVCEGWAPLMGVELSRAPKAVAIENYIEQNRLRS